MPNNLFSQRRTEEVEASDDFSKAILPISKSAPDLVNGIPVSGEDYLLVVREQAKQCAQTVVAEHPKETKQIKLPPHLRVLLQDNTAPSTVEHTSEAWRKGFAVVFKSYQSYMQKQRKTAPTNRKALKDITEAHNILYPKEEKNSNNYTITEFVPTLTQHDILRLLRYHKEWLQTKENIVEQCKWIFSLLVYLDPVLTSNNQSILRDLSRECCKLRAELSETHAGPLNAIIAIIAEVFGQADLL